MISQTYIRCHARVLLQLSRSELVQNLSASELDTLQVQVGEDKMSYRHCPTLGSGPVLDSSKLYILHLPSVVLYHPRGRPIS
jgi:hypothetical protein